MTRLVGRVCPQRAAGCTDTQPARWGQTRPTTRSASSPRRLRTGDFWQRNGGKGMGDRINGCLRFSLPSFLCLHSFANRLAGLLRWRCVSLVRRFPAITRSFGVLPVGSKKSAAGNLRAGCPRSARITPWHQRGHAAKLGTRPPQARRSRQSAAEDCREAPEDRP